MGSERAISGGLYDRLEAATKLFGQLFGGGFYYRAEALSGGEAGAFNPINEESRGKLVEATAQLHGFSHREGVSRVAEELGGDGFLNSVDSEDSARLRTGPDRIDQIDFLGGIINPKLHQAGSIAQMLHYLKPGYVQSLHPSGNQQTNAVVRAVFVTYTDQATARRVLRRWQGLLPVDMQLQEVTGAGDTRVVVAHRLFAAPGKLLVG